jgi:hypothetical protein
MTDHAISALRKHREEIREQTKRAEAQVTKLRRTLANLDAAIAILTPEHPGYVAPHWPCRRGVYFKRRELSRLVREALRDAGRPLAAGEIAAGIIAARHFPDAAHMPVAKMILSRLRVLERAGEIAKTGTTRDSRRAISDNFNEVSETGQI